MNKWKKSAAASVIIVGFTAAALGFTFPSYASGIPVIGNIFKFLDGGRTAIYDNYKTYSSEINQSAESNGIKLTIQDAIFDGEAVSITYSLESNQDLGDQPRLRGRLDIKGTDGQSGGSQISKVDKNNYVGLVTASSFLNRKESDTVHVQWNIDNIYIQDNKEYIEGNWSFAFALKATENNIQWIDRTVEHNGVKVSIRKISITPMSYIVYYDQEVSKEIQKKWHGVDIDLDIRDDLGHGYSGKGNGGSGDRGGYNMSWSKTFEKLDPNATKLMITPHLRLYEYTSDNHGSVEETRDGSASIPIPDKSGKGQEEFVLEEIIIDLVK